MVLEIFFRFRSFRFVLVVGVVGSLLAGLEKFAHDCISFAELFVPFTNLETKEAKQSVRGQPYEASTRTRDRSYKAVITTRGAVKWSKGCNQITKMLAKSNALIHE